MIAQTRANPWISLIDSDRHGQYHQWPIPSDLSQYKFSYVSHKDTIASFVSVYISRIHVLLNSYTSM